jgi:AcrR family transcriptional regulator
MAGELGNRDARAEAGPRPLSTAQLPDGHGSVLGKLREAPDAVFRSQPPDGPRPVFGPEGAEGAEGPDSALSGESHEERSTSTSELPEGARSAFKSELPEGPRPGIRAELPEGPRPGIRAELPEGPRPGIRAELPEGPRPGIRAELPEGPRPRRGAPEQTRARLIQTAAQIFNEVPYWETDSNQLAKAAGYSTGTFYRHFKDKREIFIAAYREWVVEEWNSIESRMSPALTPGESIDRASDALIEHHRRWRVFRGNLRALVTYDEELRELTQSLRLEQLEKMRLLRRMRGDPPRALERDAIHALMFERICDALADGDFRSLGCSADQAQAEFRTMMRSYLFEP